MMRSEKIIHELLFLEKDDRASVTLSNVGPSCTLLNNQTLVWNSKTSFDTFIVCNVNHFLNTVILVTGSVLIELLITNSCSIN